MTRTPEDTRGASMPKPAARMTDQVLSDAPHCHAPMHPAAPVPTPVPHPAMPQTLVKGLPTVLIGNLPAARLGDLTAHPSCVAPIPSPTGKVLPPGCPTVLVGG